MRWLVLPLACIPLLCWAILTDVQSTSQNVVGPQEVCESADEVFCNVHNPNLTCICQFHTKRSGRNSNCDDRFAIKNVKGHILRLRTTIPKTVEEFRNFDYTLGTVLDDYAMIPISHLFTIRKFCSNGTLNVYFGFIEDPQLSAESFIYSYNMHFIRPAIFLHNHDFMNQDVVPILGINAVNMLPRAQRRRTASTNQRELHNPVTKVEREEEPGDGKLFLLAGVGLVVSLTLAFVIVSCTLARNHRHCNNNRSACPGQ